jgi:uncharacterized repeat protein (TIGR04076 family)
MLYDGLYYQAARPTQRRETMADMYPVKLKVVSQKGTCAAGHKVGDEFETQGMTPDGICLVAFHSLFPALWSLMFGGSFPWSKEAEAEMVACPDAENPVVFEVRRVQPE